MIIVNAESRESKDMTVEGDMYGFGVVLIELLTGKSPADMEYGVHENIVEWARHCYSDCHLDAWIDTTIRGQAAGNDNKHGKEMVLTMNLALHCTTTDPTARPSASHVVKTLHSLMSPTTCVRVI
jgi:serine/threonine protein kinase